MPINNHAAQGPTVFRRKPYPEQGLRHQEPSPGVKVYPLGERVEVELTPAPPRQYAPGNGPLYPPVVVRKFSGRRRTDITTLP